MELWDEIELIEDVDDLSKKGIFKGYGGTVVKVYEHSCLVWFSHPKNVGEFAFANVNKECLAFKFSKIFSSEIIEEMKEMMTNIDIEKHNSLSIVNVEEYDKIELLVDKPDYNEEGVFKGMTGCVLQPYAINGKWAILFDNVGENADKSVEILVFQKDFKVIDKF